MTFRKRFGNAESPACTLGLLDLTGQMEHKSMSPGVDMLNSPIRH